MLARLPNVSVSFWCVCVCVRASSLSFLSMQPPPDQMLHITTQSTGLRLLRGSPEGNVLPVAIAEGMDAVGQLEQAAIYKPGSGAEACRS